MLTKLIEGTKCLMKLSDVLMSSVQAIDLTSPAPAHVECAPGLKMSALQGDKQAADSSGGFTMGKVSAKKWQNKRKQTKLLKKGVKSNAEVAADAGVTKVTQKQTDRPAGPAGPLACVGINIGGALHRLAQRTVTENIERQGHSMFAICERVIPCGSHLTALLL